MADGSIQVNAVEASRPARKKWLRSLIEVLAIFFICHGLSELSLIFPPGRAYPHLIWLTEGANLAAVILFGYKAWLGILPAQWIAGTAVVGRICSVVSCALRLAIAQWLLPRLKFNPRLERLRDVFLLVGIGGIVAAGIGSMAGALLLWGSGFIPSDRFWMGWRIWWIGDLGGILILTPLILTWAVPGQRRFLLHRWKEFGAFLACLLAANHWLNHQTALPAYDRYPLSYPLNPLLIWACLRFGPIGVTVAGLVVLTQSLLANWTNWEAATKVNWIGGTPFPMVQVSFAWLMALILAFVVNELHRAREVVKTSHHALSSLVETSPLAIVAVSLQREVLQWNRAAQAIFGWSGKEIVGGRLPSPAWDGLQEVFSAVLSGHSLSCVLSGRFRRDGGVVDVNIDAAPMYAADGALIAAVAILADVTAQRRMEERLQQSQRLEAVGRLAGGIAHDFNNILTVILGQAELLLEDVTDAGIRGRVTRMHQAVLRASSLTGRLLAFSRQQHLEPKFLDLNQVVLRSVEGLRAHIGEDVDLVLRLAAEGCPLYLDPVQMEQLLLNLVMNASEAMPGGGRVGIETHVIHGGEGDPPRILLAVQDDRQGMSSHAPDRNFDTSFPAGQGAGLGLAIVQGIVRQNGGTVRIASGVGRGTRMEIFFPAAMQWMSNDMLSRRALISGS